MKTKVTTVILRTYIKIVPRRNTAPTATQQNIQKKAVPKKRGSMKACEIETVISRTESKGLKEELMLDMGITQAVEKPCFRSTEVGEQSSAKVLPHP